MDVLLDVTTGNMPIWAIHHLPLQTGAAGAANCLFFKTLFFKCYHRGHYIVWKGISVACSSSSPYPRRESSSTFALSASVFQTNSNWMSGKAPNAKTRFTRSFYCMTSCANTPYQYCFTWEVKRGDQGEYSAFRSVVSVPLFIRKMPQKCASHCQENYISALSCASYTSCAIDWSKQRYNGVAVNNSIYGGYII